MLYHLHRWSDGDLIKEERQAKTTETVQTNAAKSIYAPRFDQLAEKTRRLQSLRKEEERIQADNYWYGKRIKQSDAAIADLNKNLEKAERKNGNDPFDNLFTEVDKGVKRQLESLQRRTVDDSEESRNKLGNVQQEISDLDKQILGEQQSLLDSGLPFDQISAGVKEAEDRANLDRYFGVSNGLDNIGSIGDKELIDILGTFSNGAVQASEDKSEAVKNLIGPRELASGEKDAGVLNMEVAGRITEESKMNRGIFGTGRAGEVFGTFEKKEEGYSDKAGTFFGDMLRENSRLHLDDLREASEKLETAESSMKNIREELEKRGYTSQEINQKLSEGGYREYNPPPLLSEEQIGNYIKDQYINKLGKYLETPRDVLLEMTNEAMDLLSKIQVGDKSLREILAEEGGKDGLTKYLEEQMKLPPDAAKELGEYVSERAAKYQHPMPDPEDSETYAQRDSETPADSSSGLLPKDLSSVPELTASENRLEGLRNLTSDQRAELEKDLETAYLPGTSAEEQERIAKKWEEYENVDELYIDYGKVRNNLGFFNPADGKYHRVGPDEKPQVLEGGEWVGDTTDYKLLRDSAESYEQFYELPGKDVPNPDSEFGINDQDVTLDPRTGTGIAQETDDPVAKAIKGWWPLIEPEYFDPNYYLGDTDGNVTKLGEGWKKARGFLEDSGYKFSDTETEQEFPRDYRDWRERSMPNWMGGKSQEEKLLKVFEKERQALEEAQRLQRQQPVQELESVPTAGSENLPEKYEVPGESVNPFSENENKEWWKEEEQPDRAVLSSDGNRAPDFWDFPENKYAPDSNTYMPFSPETPPVQQEDFPKTLIPPEPKKSDPPENLPVVPLTGDYDPEIQQSQPDGNKSESKEPQREGSGQRPDKVPEGESVEKCRWNGCSFTEDKCCAEERTEEDTEDCKQRCEALKERKKDEKENPEDSNKKNKE